jgi:hypothetical protein
MINLPDDAPVGTRCFYENKALKLSGWGVLVDPKDEIDADSFPVLRCWYGKLDGPCDETQEFLNALAPGVGTLPGEGYCVLPAYLLWVEK